MKIPTTDEFKKMYTERRARVARFMKQNGIGAAVFIDSEEKRESAVRYLSGHINDAVLIVFDDAYSVLVPWDEIMAKRYAFADKVVPYTKYKNTAIDAVKAVLSESGHLKNKKVELPPSTTYPEFLKYVDALEGCDIHCRENSVHHYVTELRMIKDEYEIACTKEAARIGDLIIDTVEEGIKSKKLVTETDVALLIERECREYGCERTGFDTLAAGPDRSWGIHCFPNYTSGKWADSGLSILDFGVVVNGYTSDTTVTVARGKLSAAQEKLVDLVQKAYDECLKLYKPGLSIRDAAIKADEVFAAEKRKMPHGLGHAIGLEIHEPPRVNLKAAETLVFKPGMIVTLEPGLYDEELGGCRLENDVLITDSGNEVITHSRIIKL